MTILKIVAIRDRAIDAFGQPIFVHAIGQAMRSFTDEINNPQSELNKHPEDYDLYVIGTYDQTDGSIQAETPNMIAIGKNVVTE